MKQYSIILADPPWRYNDTLDETRTLKYPTMTIDDIVKLPVKSIAAENAVLFLWGTWPQLFDETGVSPIGRVITGWGFTFKTCAFVWVKTNNHDEVNQLSFLPVDSFAAFLGMGRWTRSNTEFVLLCTRGKEPPKREDAGVHQIIYAPIEEHSRKPAETRARIVRLCGDLPRIELFARQATAGWDIWGNQVESTIEL